MKKKKHGQKKFLIEDEQKKDYLYEIYKENKKKILVNIFIQKLKRMVIQNQNLNSDFISHLFK